ncbi:unnamed protein product [Rotaria sp. Silwood1]|nr:unnamed protein product [Rotaria sp. Silwood1]CAF0956007.1 unnamed protein product [Rotaria sp. Silwood1]CAF3378904.1 unnamed protein product [Rotaria sp. Silwood1]CAF4514938.1 unnamed protein product [Rotaria sp. Silwood1]CAF5029155.1 unnamed protein product [Rotaria sp. Silwood1]
MADNMKLSDDQRQQLDECYKKNRDKLPVCPTCKTNNDVIPTVRGKPSAELLLYAEEGNVKLSGCTQSYNGWCKKCETFL